MDFRSHNISASIRVQCTTCTSILIDPEDNPLKKQQGNRVSTKPLLLFTNKSIKQNDSLNLHETHTQNSV